MKRLVESYHPWKYSAARVAFGTWRCSVPNPTEDRLLKGFEPSTKGFATITNQSTERPSLWKMADWLLSGWKGVTEIEIWSSNSVSICYCNSISLLSLLAPGLLQPEISFLLNPTLISEIRKETCSCNMWCPVTVLPEDQKYPPLHQCQDNWNALPSTQQWMFLLHLHST